MVKTKLFIIRLLLLAVFSLIAVFTLIYSAQSQEAKVPEDFEIIFTSSPAVVAKEIDTETLTIKADGTVIASPRVRYSGQIPNLTPVDLPEMYFTLGPEALTNIFAAITDNDFFNLQENYNDPNILDGDWAELTVTAGGNTHTVRTQNIKVIAFDDITVTINANIPLFGRLKYNAINGADYEEVER